MSKRYEYEVRLLPSGEVIASRDEELPARVYLGATWVDELEVVDIERSTTAAGEDVLERAIVYVRRPKAPTTGNKAGQATGGLRN